MSIFESNSYRDYLRQEIEKRRKPGIMTELARLAGCDRTYLSQVLAGRAQLTTDQTINLAEAFALSDAESDFFLLLVMKDRAASPVARKRFESKIQRLRNDNMRVSKVVAGPKRPSELPDKAKLRYYSNWRYAAAHILASIGEFNYGGALARVLDVSESEALALLQDLLDMGLIEKDGPAFRHRGGNLHVPADSPLVTYNHLNWRMKALEQVRRPGGLHYTDVFSVSRDDVPVLNRQLLEFIQDQRKKISASGAESVQVFCCDLFSLA